MQKYSWGGYRPGSGRRPKGEVSGVSHHTRGEVSARAPRAISRPTHDRLIEDQLAQAVARSGAGDLEKVLRGGETWTVE